MMSLLSSVTESTPGTLTLLPDPASPRAPQVILSESLCGHPKQMTPMNHQF
jgi:hypothetical protein